MRPPPTCPRCAAELREPGLWSSDWQCPLHGAVLPYRIYPRVNAEAVDTVCGQARVPVWAPLPLPLGWLVSGVAAAGDERTGARATALACSGPSPLGGPADLLLVTEEPGIGLGARYAGLPGPDPGSDVVGKGAPDAKIEAAGHPTPLWSLPTADGCAPFVGEAKALWLWLIVWPAAAGVLLYENLALADLRDGVPDIELAFGTLSPRLSAG